MQKNYRKLSIEYPTQEYEFLKMACAKQNISLKDFVTQAVMRKVEEYENQIESPFYKGLTKQDIESAISLNDLEKELGWDKL